MLGSTAEQKQSLFCLEKGLYHFNFKSHLTKCDVIHIYSN